MDQRRTSQLGVANTEGYVSLRIQARKKQSVHLLPCRAENLRTVVHGDDFYNSRNIWWHQMLHEELSKKWKCVERGILGPPGTPNTIQDIRSPEQNYHMEGGMEFWWNQMHVMQSWWLIYSAMVPEEQKSRHHCQGFSGRPQERHCFSQWWRSNPVQISCNASSLLGTRSTRSASSDKIFSTRATTTNYQPHAYAQTSCTIPKVSTHAWHNSFLIRANSVHLWCGPDADHAGCVKTRKSVSGGVLMAGGCCIKTYSKGQRSC